MLDDMQVDPLLRRASALQIIDALVAMDVDDSGEGSADDAIALALGPIADRMSGDVHQRAVFAAALDLLWFVTMQGAMLRGQHHEVQLANLRSSVPQLFPVPGDPTLD